MSADRWNDASIREGNGTDEATGFLRSVFGQRGCVME